MLLKSMKISNIRSYLDQTIKFPEGSVLLSGDIGTGKSTILLALEFALFGVQRGDVNSYELLRHGKDKGTVELEFEINGKLYKIKRSLKRGKFISQDICQMTEGGATTEYTPTELKSRILDILGYPQDMLKKNVPIFRFTVYTPQEQMKHIMLSKDDRMSTLRKIFNMDKYGRMRDNVKIFSSELRSIKRELGAFSKDLEDVEKEKEETKEKNIRLSSDIKKIELVLDKINKNLEEKVSDLAEAKKNLQDTNKMKQMLLEKESVYNNEKYKAERSEKEMQKIEEKIEEYKEKLVKYSNLRKPETPLEYIETELRRTVEEKNKIISERMSLEKEIKNLKTVYENGICVMCSQKVSDPESFKSNIANKAERTIKLLKSAEEKESAIENLSSEKEYITNYEYEMRDKENIEDEIKNKVSEKMSLQQDLSDLSLHISDLEKEIEKIKSVIQDTAGIEKRYEKIEEEMKRVSDEKLTHEKAKSRAEQELEDTEKSIQTIENSIREKKQAREKISSINELNSWFEEQFINLVNSVEKHVLLTIQREFDTLFQEWFNIIIQEENLQVRINEDFSPVIIQNSFETSYENLSGGEKTSVALAYRLALNKVINSLIDSIKTKDIIILDEPTDGLSTEQLDRIRDMLEELNLRQIILVSHEPKIDTFVDSVIRFYKEHHISRVENN